MLQNGEKTRILTEEDQQIQLSGIESITGVRLEEVKKSLLDGSQSTIIEKILSKIGTSSGNLESKIVPELFGIQL